MLGVRILTVIWDFVCLYVGVGEGVWIWVWARVQAGLGRECL